MYGQPEQESAATGVEYSEASNMDDSHDTASAEAGLSIPLLSRDGSE